MLGGRGPGSYRHFTTDVFKQLNRLPRRDGLQLPIGLQRRRIRPRRRTDLRLAAPVQIVGVQVVVSRGHVHDSVDDGWRAGYGPASRGPPALLRIIEELVTARRGRRQAFTSSASRR
jgi:hypothetical protein